MIQVMEVKKKHVPNELMNFFQNVLFFFKGKKVC